MRTWRRSGVRHKYTGDTDRERQTETHERHQSIPETPKKPETPETQTDTETDAYKTKIIQAHLRDCLSTGVYWPYPPVTRSPHRRPHLACRLLGDPGDPLDGGPDTEGNLGHPVTCHQPSGQPASSHSSAVPWSVMALRRCARPRPYWRPVRPAAGGAPGGPTLAVTRASPRAAAPRRSGASTPERTITRFTCSTRPSVRSGN